MAWRINRNKRNTIDCDGFTIADSLGNSIDGTLFPHHCNTTGPVPKFRRRSNMVRVYMRLDHLGEFQLHFTQQSNVVIDFREDRIDKDGLAAVIPGQQIGIGTGVLVKELSEYQNYTLSPNSFTVSSRITNFCIFPVMVMGNSSTILIWCGIL